MADAVDELLEILACPRCRGKLTRSDDRLLCDHCGVYFAIVDGIPMLRPTDAVDLASTS